MSTKERKHRTKLYTKHYKYENGVSKWESVLSRFRGTSLDSMSPSATIYTFLTRLKSELNNSLNSLPHYTHILCLSPFPAVPPSFSTDSTSLYTSTSHTSATHFTALTGGVRKRTSALFMADASACSCYAFQSIPRRQYDPLSGAACICAPKPQIKTHIVSNIKAPFKSPILKQQKPKLKARSGHCCRSHNALLHWSLSRLISPQCCSVRSIWPGHPFKQAKETTWVQSIVWITTSVCTLCSKQLCQKCRLSFSFSTW